ncbi:hypothetical protein DPEC_G00018620 [Dallia pectoralis]|uniref:Uncharacterized protein n=1 Tax=Dallia pectoralis TaxID=75939 RepID=A0ACC2HFH8_DALPE|nr:hypothetical protein DPEC_G00018620 [Dallia pectoralis]
MLFTGGRDTAANGYRLILEKMGLEGRVSHAQAKKKWDNLKTKYKVGDTNVSVLPQVKGQRMARRQQLIGPGLASWTRH